MVYSKNFIYISLISLKASKLAVWLLTVKWLSSLLFGGRFFNADEGDGNIFKGEKHDSLSKLAMTRFRCSLISAAICSRTIMIRPCKLSMLTWHNHLFVAYTLVNQRRFSFGMHKRMYSWFIWFFTVMGDPEVKYGVRCTWNVSSFVQISFFANVLTETNSLNELISTSTSHKKPVSKLTSVDICVHVSIVKIFQSKIQFLHNLVPQLSSFLINSCLVMIIKVNM
jgi:hypothetical protein